MLVLTRRIDQSIRIGDHITITVVEVRGEQVRIGIDAPRDLPIHRVEVLEQIQDENARAAAATPDDVAAALDSLPAPPPTETPVTEPE